MLVIKVGGSVLNSSDGFVRFSRIVSRVRNDRLLVVISAFAKTTRNLRDSASFAAKGFSRKAESNLNSIIKYHSAFAKGLLGNSPYCTDVLNYINNCRIEISALLDSISITRELPPRILDQILSYGESLALNITHAFLEHKSINHAVADSSKIIVTDDNFGRANPIEADTRSRIAKYLMPALKSSHLVVTQGFVAATKKGVITTMGTESSNLSAAIYAKLLDARELHIWSDVEGIRSADPDIVADTSPVPVIDYDLAYSLGNSGLKLIYPEMTDYARDNGIKLIFKSAVNPDGNKTIVKARAKTIAPIITSKSAFHFYKISSRRLSDYSGEHDDMIFHDGTDIILITRNMINSFENADADIISVFNVSCKAMIDAAARLDMPYLFLSIAEGKSAIIVAPEFTNSAIAKLHKLVVSKVKSGK